MNNKQQSIIFWIIFLAIVIAIAIIIVPKYSILSKDILVSHARNIAANLTASSAANYTQRKANSSNGISIKNCKDVSNIVANSLPTEYMIVDQDIKPDNVATCTLKGLGIVEIQFSVLGIS